MSAIKFQSDYDAIAREVRILETARDYLTSTEKLTRFIMGMAQSVSETIEDVDYEPALDTIKTEIRKRQEALDAFDDRFAWGEHGMAQRVYS
jgi:hypothetical protein